MSTGETPPTARFTSPSSSNANTTTKKYPGTPKSPLTTNATTGNNRNSLARQRLLTSKISAPRPMNLPSLRREHAVGTEVPASSPSASHTWGSSTSSPPSNSFTQPSELENKAGTSPEPAAATVASTTSPKLDESVESSNVNNESNDSKNNSSSKLDLPSSPPSQPSTTTPARAWAVPTITQPVTQVPSTDFPTAAEAAGKKKSLISDDKEYLKYAASDPNHTSWDEMVSEDLDDFSVDVVEFDDGTKVQVEGTTDEAVAPSERFTDDYDRSYPPKSHYNNESTDHHHTAYKSNYRRSEDHGFNTRYTNSVHGYDNRRHSATTATTGPNESNRWSHRRESVESSNSNRRSSYDRKSSGPSHNHHSSTPSTYHPTTLLQRPRRLSEQSLRSDHSREDTFYFEQHTNPLQIIPEPSTSSVPSPVAVVEEITAAQREVMLTAAERAKKRRDEEEAEFEAARVRARQKADALAEKARLAALEKSEKEVATTLVKIEKRPSTKDKIESDNSSKVKKRDSISSKSYSATSRPTTAKSSSLPNTSKPWNLVAAKKEITIEKRPKSESDESNNKAHGSSKSTTNEKEKTKEEKQQPKPIEPIKVDKFGKPFNEDEQNWEMFVSKIKTEPTAPILKSEVTSNDWNSFATRLQKSVLHNQKAFNAKHKSAMAEKEGSNEKEDEVDKKDTTNGKKEDVVEVLDYAELEDAGYNSNQGKGQQLHRGWTRNDEEHGGVYNHGERNNIRSRGGLLTDRATRGVRINQGNTSRRQSEGWRQSNYNTEPENETATTTIVTEILKHEPVNSTSNSTSNINNTSKKTKLSDLLKEATSPIFPESIQKLVGKKPANISFMIDIDESDNDITMMDTVVEDKKEDVSNAPEVMDTTNVSETADVISVPEAVDETSVTSSTTSTPPKAPFQQNGHTKFDSSSPRRLNVNPNFPVLVYQYPLSQQHTETNNNHSSGYSARSKGLQQQQQQRPMGVYLMPPQQYMTGNQYMVPYSQSGAGVQPIYYPAVPWQAQYNGNGSNTSPRPNFEQQRRLYNNNNNNNHHSNNYNKFSTNNGHMSEWEAIANSNGYQSQRFAHSSYQRGTSYRKRGAWSNNQSTHTKVRGSFHNNHSRKYPDVNSTATQQQQHTERSSTMETNV